MAFNTGLSGLRAASIDLDVTGNNIANASTVGFKSSEVQFGDLYASGFIGAGTNPVGDGVAVQSVAQNFSQGNIAFTDRDLDLAINGDGYFVLNNGGEIRYSRAGQFGVDKDGFVVNNSGMKLQGFMADIDGNLSGVRSDLQLDNSNLSPRRTTNVISGVNLDSGEDVLEISGTRLVTGQPAQDTQISGQAIQFDYPDGTSITTTIPANSTAREAADLLGLTDGVSASARTETTIAAGDVANNQTVQIQGTSFNIPDAATAPDPMAWLIDAVNDSPLNSVNASLSTGGDLRLIESRGNDLSISYTTGGGTTAYTQTGQLTITLDRDVEVATPAPPLIAGASSETFTANIFDPNDQRTYNHATSSTLYDSLGNPHVMTQYFVKEPVAGGDSVWAMYVQVDGEDVGDPPDSNGNPTRARFDLQFNEDGTLALVDGDPGNKVMISNWTPRDPSGLPNGADGPRLISQGATTPLPEPPVSSNFVIDLRGSTQYGSDFSVDEQRQNGYTTGRLSGLDVDDSGILFARYTNGQSKALGQVSLASFRNTDGLTPVGETTWVETFKSGAPIIGQPNTGTLGSINASSIEESNVDLSEELVNLIIAQRNYQANAKTIETADAVTQAIINLR